MRPLNHGRPLRHRLWRHAHRCWCYESHRPCHRPCRWLRHHMAAHWRPRHHPDVPGHRCRSSQHRGWWRRCPPPRQESCWHHGRRSGQERPTGQRSPWTEHRPSQGTRNRRVLPSIGLLRLVPAWPWAGPLPLAISLAIPLVVRGSRSVGLLACQALPQTGIHLSGHLGWDLYLLLPSDHGTASRLRGGRSSSASAAAQHGIGSAGGIALHWHRH
mmetsp:Transcript_17860/g.39170  ORF Transcript_17860/g.39170 Transcript_17860/m.39170 type:complete len:215 (-) Transcript_17860:824-1468(-)